MRPGLLCDPETLLLAPASPNGTGVVLVAGSSGRVDSARAELLRAHGATVLAVRWFGGPGQQPGPFEVPLELFSEALDVLAPDCDRLALVGLSFGAEAALLTAAREHRVVATVAFAPTPVVWGGWTGTSWTSHWTADQEPLAYVPFVRDWQPDSEPPAYRELYRRSLERDPDAVESARIPVERISGELILVAGGDDQVWPSVQFAAQIAARRDQHRLDTTVVSVPDAGHRAVLPGEPVPTGGANMLRGGTPEADRALGRAAWPALAAALRLTDPVLP